MTCVPRNIVSFGSRITDTLNTYDEVVDYGKCESEVRPVLVLRARWFQESNIPVDWNEVYSSTQIIF